MPNLVSGVLKEHPLSWSLWTRSACAGIEDRRHSPDIARDNYIANLRANTVASWGHVCPKCLSDNDAYFVDGRAHTPPRWRHVRAESVSNCTADYERANASSCWCDLRAVTFANHNRTDL